MRAFLGIKPTIDQVRAWEGKNAELLAADKRVHKKWKTPGTLGTFYREYVGRAIVNYHSALVDALALHDIELHCAELKEKREKWRQTKHLAKPIQEIATRVANNARTYGEKNGHDYSRPPYGSKRPKCFHNYPCTVSKFNCKRTGEKIITFRCNNAFNGKFIDKDKGEDKRCAFKMSDAQWIEEQKMAANMQILIDLEGSNSVQL